MKDVPERNVNWNGEARNVDSLNRFETRTTHLISRAEWLVGLGGSVTLALLHWGEINWLAFAGFFAVIDVLGYLPGAIAFRRSQTGKIGRGYYVAYNVMHSLLTAALIAGVWSIVFQPEWALLALPIHLFGDRALFGNTTKPFGVPFEPAILQEFVQFEREYKEIEV
ncbi:hypothetical protein ACNQVK_02550 [Mycobacterium sp. 134]|uniref:hypothetical protein n=1 Tax=unclassified Mycobacterium TaxID=2642494 RepID=UPI001E5755FA|nr:hypothetical protein [Mycobacterium sp. E802]